MLEPVLKDLHQVMGEKLTAADKTFRDQLNRLVNSQVRVLVNSQVRVLVNRQVRVLIN